ncbi:MAG: uridine kinase [Deltaproteobacteria bacterium]|nr:uridine kinase [Deltaproteobacteria bacterium]
MGSAPARPLVIGIAGGTGSGKSTVAANLAAGLPPQAAVIVDHDAYYRNHPDMPLEKRAGLNYDHPNALDNDLLLEHLDLLRGGKPVDLPIYDFVNHMRKTETRHLAPTPVIIVEGILVFVDERVRERLDIKIFVDTDADIRVFRRIRRDMESRGRTFQQVREQYYKTVRPMHLEFVQPSKRWADLIIPEGGNNHVALDMIIAKLTSSLGS